MADETNFRLVQQGKPYSSSTTAKQVSVGLDLSGKVIIITGANTGTSISGFVVLKGHKCMDRFTSFPSDFLPVPHLVVPIV